MSAQEDRPFPSTDSAHQSFTDLYIFLRDAFRQKGLVSIPPEVLQRFKQCPLQDIECDDIPSFAKLFEGTHSNNRFRLEANSFVYTVQILFHLRQNLVQERILHSLMMSVRLLKDEKEASRRLSELAAKEVDRFAVARKRTTISNKLIPWLLKHFSQDSTTIRLKLVAAQSLFYLLQGDEEAKKIVSSAPQKERWSLGRTIIASPQLPLRILTANVLRELSLAAIDLRLFWPPEVLNDDIKLDSTFIANTGWLESTIKYLKYIDDRCAVPEDSRTKIHKISSLVVGSIALSDVTSGILSTISESLLFIIPADRKRALQILEVPLIANMQWDRRDGISGSVDTPKQEVELQLQLQNTGFYIFNGSKNAIDRVNLSFSTEGDCDSFCEAMAKSLQNIPGGSAALGKPRPKKQSKAVMIDLSQNVVISGDTQLLSQPLGVPRKVSTSQRIDVSASIESSMSPTSLQEVSENEASPLQPKEGQERMLSDTGRVQRDLARPSKVEAETTSSGAELENLPLDSVVPALSESAGQERATAEDPGNHVPQQEGHYKAAIKFPIATPENLQHLARNALWHSAGTPDTGTANRAVSTHRSEERKLASDIPLLGDNSLQPPSTPGAQANSAKRMTLTTKSNKQVASTSKAKPLSQIIPTESKSSTNLANRRRAANSVPNGEGPVDWDEDLRGDESDHEDESSLASMSKRGVSRSAKDGLKKKAAAKKTSRTSRAKKKAPSKAKVKEDKPQTASAITGIAATRSRRAAANVSYIDQSEHEEQSQDTLDEGINVVSPAQTKQTEVATMPLHTENDDAELKAESTNGQNLIKVVKSPDAKAHSTHISARATVEVQPSDEGISATTEEEMDRGGTEGLQHDQSEREASSPHAQKSGKTNTSYDVTEKKVQPAVEVVDDSHPMDKAQLANVIGAARKSFGSALMDVMNENGMQPFESASLVESRAKPFGDKVAFIESVKTALKQSPSKSEAKKSGSTRSKHIQTPSTNKSERATAAGPELAHEPLKSVLPSKIVQSEGSAPRQPVDERVEVTTLPPQKADAETPTIDTEQPGSPNGSLSSAPDGRSDIRQPQHSIADGGRLGSEAKKRSPSSHHQIQKPISPAKADSPPVGSASNNKSIFRHNNERKRPNDVPLGSPKRTKRARMTDPGPDKSQRDAELRQGLALQSNPTAKSKGNAAPNKPRISEPSARNLRGTMHNDQTSVIPLGRQEQGPAKTAGSQSLHPETKSPARASNPAEHMAQTPQPPGGVDHHTSLPNDNLNRKAHIVGFSAKGPQNQGVPTSDTRRRGVEQSSSVPRETHKHLAFKKLHSNSKAGEHSTEAVLKRNQPFDDGSKRKVSFSFSDRESIHEDIHIDQENAQDTLAAPTTSKVENGKSASQTSKVDENGSPRLHLRETTRLSIPSNDPAGSDNSEDLDESMDSDSVFEESESESASFGLNAAVSKFTVKMQKAAEIKCTRSRPSIGLGNLLDQRFPQASKSIETGIFKAPVLAETMVSTKASPKPRTTNHLSNDQTMNRTLGFEGQLDNPISVKPDETPSFHIENLNSSVGQEQPSSATSARVRRLRSSTPQSPDATRPRPDESPPSFNTRLDKMIMPPPPKREKEKVVTPDEYSSGLHKGREQSAMMDAETTLVNGEAFEEESNLPPPHRQQRLSLSSSSEEAGPSTSVSQQVAVDTLPSDRRIWNQKVAETQQTVLEMLDQVSRKLLMRFSSAEEGIQLRLDHYRYGGHKILNNLVEQFDNRVTQEKEIPSPRISGHRERLEDTISQLQQAKRSTRIGPSLDDLQKSHDKRSGYVLANLQKFQQRLQG